MRRLLLLFAAGLCVAAHASAQSQADPSPAPVPAVAPSSSDAPAPAPEKKVWTNEDVSDLRSTSEISTVGATPAKPGAKRPQPARPGVTGNYQTRIARLENQIPPIDKEMAELQDAISGKATGDAKSSTRPRNVWGGDWNDELQKLQTKKQGLLDQIAALRDEARHHGVAPNTLP
jgi:hypothetical protein